ncbi:MAG: hypothetical protein FJ100_10100 [Deltaproteobacteria bacterium]|nr:hypothetical protein [Deltaproteobacteria bacterium]
MSSLTRFSLAAGLVFGLAACPDSAPSSTADATATGDTGADGAPAADGSGTAATTTYKPFDQANADPYSLRVVAYEKIKAIVGDAKLDASMFGGGCDKYNPAATTPSDPTKLGSLYVESATLQTSVKKRKDKHADNAGADLGALIDAQVCASLAAGATTTAASDAAGGVQWHGQLIQKGLLHYFYAAWYGYFFSGNRKDWDELMAAYGKSFDGKVDGGLAGLVAKRDANCGTTLAKDIWPKLLGGKAILEAALAKQGLTGNADKLTTLPPEMTALAAELDSKMQQVFALSLGHEFQEIAAGKSAVVKLAEARAFWRIVKPRVAAFDKAKGTKHVETLDKVDQDDPAKVDTAAGLAAIKAVWGLDVAALCK